MKPMASILLRIAVQVLAISAAGRAADSSSARPSGTYTTSWVGNSLAGPEAHIPLAISGLFVAEDGACITNTGWDESGGEVTVFDSAGTWRTAAGHTHGWGYGGGACVVANDHYLFIAQQVDSENGNLVDADTWPKKGQFWFGVSRRPRSDVHKGAPFASGKGGAGDTIARSLLLIREEANTPIPSDAFGSEQQIARGISALAASESKLYVADVAGNSIDAYEVESMAPIARWENLPRISAMSVDRSGNVWIAQPADHDRPAMVVELDATGRPDGKEIDLSPGGHPVALAFDHHGNILVADGGVAANVGQQQWAKYGLMFVDNASIDPLTGDVYSSEEHYRFDWSRSGPGTEWSYFGRTFDPARYPQDLRHRHELPPLMRRLNGDKLYAFASDQTGDGIFVYRFDAEQSGEVAVPSACITKSGLNIPGAPAGAVIWRDANGDGKFDAGEFQQPELDNGNLDDACWGWWVDERGDVWQTVNGDGPKRGIRHYPLAGFDEHGNPIYRFHEMTSAPVPPPFLNKINDGLERAVYSPSDDVMFLAGYTREAQSETLWGSFRVVARYDHWQQGNRTPAWVVQMPWGYHAGSKTIDAPIGFAVAGEYLFEVGLSTTSKVRIYRSSDGSYVGDLVPNNDIFTEKDTGWVDMRPFGVQASVRPDGSIAVLVEDDFHGKSVIYRWRPEH